jgi:hypothetical protein
MRGRGTGGMRTVEAVHLRRDLRELGHGQLVAIGQDHGAEHRVLELADIARPVIAADQPKASAGDAAQLLAFLGGEARQEAPREIGDVLAALAQRRHVIGKTLRR